MYNKKAIPGTKGGIIVENSWYKDNTDEKIHVVPGIIFISLIILTKIIIML
jgi:hypothetical protein